MGLFLTAVLLFNERVDGAPAVLARSASTFNGRDGFQAYPVG